MKELQYASIVGVAKGYVASCDDSCYLFSASAATIEAARRTQIGPLIDVDACKRKAYQLTHDSLKVMPLVDF
jgi:hypothetical protein